MELSTVDTWLGPFTAIVDHDGAVLASGWTADEAALMPLMHSSLRKGDLRTRTDLGDVTKAITAFHDGELTAPEAIAVRQHSDGEYLRLAWQVLRGVPADTPISYTEFARRTGNPTAIRAAAQACARNAAALFVPCHRVLRADGGLGGFRWGESIKQALLDHELSYVDRCRESGGKLRSDLS